MLSKKIESWTAPYEFWSQIGEMGFTVPQKYRDRLVKFCRENGGENTIQLEVYWSELSKEFVLSGGGLFSKNVGNENTRYRSDVLNSLAEENNNDVFSLHPGLKAWNKYNRANNGLPMKQLLEDLELAKSEEIKHLPSPDIKWNGDKRSLNGIFESICHGLGFRTKRFEQRGGFGAGKALFKELNSGVLLLCWLEMSGRSTPIHSPAQCVIADGKDLSSGFSFDNGQFIAPGTEFYRRFAGTDRAVFNLWALVSIFEAFGRNLSRTFPEKKSSFDGNNI